MTILRTPIKWCFGPDFFLNRDPDPNFEQMLFLILALKKCTYIRLDSYPDHIGLKSPYACFKRCQVQFWRCFQNGFHLTFLCKYTCEMLTIA